MIPDFPKEKAKLQEFINSILIRKHKEHLGPFAEIPSYTHHEGDKWKIGENEEIEYAGLEAELVIKLTDVPSMSWESVHQKIDDIAKEMARQLAEKIIGDIRATSAKAGNLIDAGGRKLSKEHLLEMLERFDMSFDESGELNRPVILMHPDLWERVRDDMKTWENDPDFKTQHELIVARKREVWCDRESNRKLVD
jgi:hypothetical protein